MAASPSPRPATTPATAPAEPTQLTPAQVTAQIAAADVLRSRLEASSAAVSAANRRLDQLATRSSGLLSRLAAARDRPLAEQVQVARATPDLAARPGRSNHGLGLAVDLCGGVQSFGTAAHLWMQHNAPLYGWYHPAWAEPSGSMPEPWHWEYAG